MKRFDAKILRFYASLVVLVAGCAMLASAQNSPANPDPKPDSVSAAPNDVRTETLTGQLVEQSREAAGEEDENAQFKQSGSVRWLAKHTGLSVQGAYWLGFILNFAIIAGAVFYMWKSKAPQAFRERRSTIRREIDEAKRASSDANRRLSDIESRLARLDTEISKMKTAAESDAAAEEQRIRAAAEEDTRKIVNMAEQEIDAMAKTARRDLKVFAADLAVTLAEQQIKIDPETDRGLVRNFMGDLVNSQGRNGQ